MDCSIALISLFLSKTARILSTPEGQRVSILTQAGLNIFSIQVNVTVVLDPQQEKKNFVVENTFMPRFQNSMKFQMYTSGARLLISQVLNTYCKRLRKQMFEYRKWQRIFACGKRHVCVCSTGWRYIYQYRKRRLLE